MIFSHDLKQERTQIINYLLYEHETRYQADYIEQKSYTHSPLDLGSIAPATTCSFSGKKPGKLLCSYLETLQKLCKTVMDAYDSGYRTFLCGMDRGMEQWAAHVVLTLRDFHPDVRVVAVLPHEGLESDWTQDEQNAYRMLLQQADATQIKTDGNTLEWMLEHSGRHIIIATDHPEENNTIISADAQKNIEIIRI